MRLTTVVVNFSRIDVAMTEVACPKSISQIEPFAAIDVKKTMQLKLCLGSHQEINLTRIPQHITNHQYQSTGSNRRLVIIAYKVTTCYSLGVEDWH